MIYTLSSQYSIRALLHLAAQASNQYCRIEDVSESEKIPPAFLAKLVQRMVKKGLLRSLKGLRGGIELARPASEITLFMIVDAIDDLSRISVECALGLGECSAETPCVLHERWKSLRDQQIEFMQSITIAELVRQTKKSRTKRR
jgi:Rrf2 family protein